jgi:uncharacterized membrane protein
VRVTVTSLLEILGVLLVVAGVALQVDELLNVAAALVAAGVGCVAASYLFVRSANRPVKRIARTDVDEFA